jgi:hypothetical protein
MGAYHELWQIEAMRWHWCMQHPFLAFGPAVVVIVLYAISTKIWK